MAGSAVAFMLILYGTSPCHLCEQAQQIVQQAGVNAQVVDIADNEVLFERYGWFVPVLYCTNTQAELFWPFDVTSVRAFVR